MEWLSNLHPSVQVSIIVTLGGSIVAWLGRQWNKRDPVTRATARTVLVGSQVDIIGAVNSGLVSDMKRLREEMDSLLPLLPLPARVELLENDQDVLISALEKQHDWQEGGAKPPPPIIPDQAIKLLQKHRERRRRLRLQAE